MLYHVPEDVVIAILCCLQHEFPIKFLSSIKQENEFLRLHGNVFNIHFVGSAEIKS
jgi:hypothetical protein